MAIVAISDVNLNEVKPWNGEANILPPGDYIFEITDVEQKQSSKGNPQMELSLEVIAGVEPVTEQYNGAKSKHWLSLLPAAAGRVRNMIDACGIRLAAKGTFDDQDLIGRQFAGTVVENVYQKMDAGTGATRDVVNTRIQNERSLSDADLAAPAPAPEPEPEPELAPAPVRAAAPAAVTPTRAVTSLPRPPQRPVPRR